MIDSIGIVGYGFVGSAIGAFSSIKEVNIYDINKKDHNSRTAKFNAYNSSVIFISVPTNPLDGRLDTSIVEACLKDYKRLNERPHTTLVIKSTLPVGFCDEMATNLELSNLVFNPEFLTQRTAHEDFIGQKEVYLAGAPLHTAILKKLYQEFFDHCGHKDVQFFETPFYSYVELLKLVRNSFYALKVSFCNNIYNLCGILKVDYNIFRTYFTHGEWVEEQHTQVPGPDGKCGYGGACLPKDTLELLNFARHHNINFKMLEEAIYFNQTQRHTGKEINES